MFKYAVYPPFGVTHTGWVVDGKPIPVSNPTPCVAGTRLIIGFGHKTESVYAVLRADTVAGVVSNVQQAKLIEEPKPPEPEVDNHDIIAAIMREAAAMNNEPEEP